MPRYILPNFNLVCNIYRNASGPPAVPAVQITANLSPGELNNDAYHVANSPVNGTGGMWLRLPRGTDVRDSAAPGGTDVVECPAGSGRLYDVVWVDDIGLGFANEHRVALLAKRSPWPVPFPSGSGVGPGPGSPGFYGAASLQTAGVAAQSLTLAGSPCVAGVDRSYSAFAVYFNPAVPIVYTVDGVAAAPVISIPFIDALGNSGEVGILESPVGAIAHTFKVDVGVGNTAFFEMIAINVSNPPPAIFGAANNLGVEPPPPSVSVGGGGIPATPNFCLVAFESGGGPAALGACVAPIVDFVAALNEVVLGGNFTLNFGGAISIPVGPFTAARTAGTAGDTWGACVFGRS